MWSIKNINFFIYLDVRSEVNPCIVADNKFLPFRSNIFSQVFFDPPFISMEGVDKRLPKFDSSIHRKGASFWFRYGLDISYSAITKLIYCCNVEFFRVLKDDGLLFLRWNDSQRPLYKALSLLKRWKVLMKIPYKSKLQTGLGRKNKNISQSWWVILIKKMLTEKEISNSLLPFLMINTYQKV